MAEIVSGAGVLFTGAMQNLTTVGQTITSTPVLMLGILVPVAFLAIGVFKRLLSI